MLQGSKAPVTSVRHSIISQSTVKHLNYLFFYKMESFFFVKKQKQNKKQ